MDRMAASRDAKGKKEVTEMKQTFRGIIHGLMCKLNRHKYDARIVSTMSEQNLNICKHCGKLDWIW
jgi:hypothetical protein